MRKIKKNLHIAEISINGTESATQTSFNTIINLLIYIFEIVKFFSLRGVSGKINSMHFSINDRPKKSVIKTEL